MKELNAPAAPKKDERDYDAENALDNLMRAEEHKADPEMMKRVHKIAGRKHKALQGIKHNFKSIADIKAYTQEKYGKPGKDSGNDE